jgi:methylated-DNA-protein-cysteine methyltransferase-like protein
MMPGGTRTSRPTRYSESWRRIYAVVRRIPPGRVATYGQVAWVAGLPRQARLVGYALHAAAEGDPVPWHRVVNAGGGISARAEGPGAGVLQRLRLEQEGVVFDARGRVALARYGWRPRGWPPVGRTAGRGRAG